MCEDNKKRIQNRERFKYKNTYYIIKHSFLSYNIDKQVFREQKRMLHITISPAARCCVVQQRKGHKERR